MAEDPICVLLSERGKWHVEQRGQSKTACGVAFDSAEVRQWRFLSLIDSRHRCRNDECIAARNRAAGRV